MSDLYLKKRRIFLFTAPLLYGFIAFLYCLIFPKHQERAVLVFIVAFLIGHFLIWRTKSPDRK